MLSDFISLCTIPFTWQYSTALITCFIILMAIRSLKFEVFWIMVNKSPPSQSLGIINNLLGDQIKILLVLEYLVYPDDVRMVDVFEQLEFEQHLASVLFIDF